MKRNITIVNAHWSNRGDEAALRPILDMLLAREEQLTIIFKDKQDVQKFPYDNVNYFSAQFLPKDIDEIFRCIYNEKADNLDSSLERLVNTIKKSDLVIYSPGGAVISSNFWWVKQLEYLTPFVCAKEFNIPIVVAAPSMGPFDQDDSYNEIIQEYISYSKRVIVREPISKKYLKEIGVESVIDSIDTAFYDTGNANDCCELLHNDKLLHEFMKSHEKIVAMTLSDFSWSVPLKQYRNVLKANESVMREFIKKITCEGYGVLLIPQLFGNQNDSKYLEDFKIKGCFVLSDKYDTYFQQFIISKCYALIGMRYHSNIFAAKGGVPFIAIGYEEKMYGFMEEWGLTEYLIRIDTLNIHELCEKWNKLCTDHSEMHTRLQSFREKWKKRAGITMNSIIEEIENLE